jgi:hypothetical protein
MTSLKVPGSGHHLIISLHINHGGLVNLIMLVVLRIA